MLNRFEVFCLGLKIYQLEAYDYIDKIVRGWRQTSHNTIKLTWLVKEYTRFEGYKMLGNGQWKYSSRYRAYTWTKPDDHS